MKLSELIEQLTALKRENDDPEIHLAHQPTYPIVFELAGVVEIGVNDEVIDEAEDDIITSSSEEEAAEAAKVLDELVDTNKRIIYLSEGVHVGYGSSKMWPNQG